MGFSARRVDAGALAGGSARGAPSGAAGPLPPGAPIAVPQLGSPVVAWSMVLGDVLAFAAAVALSSLAASFVNEALIGRPFVIDPTTARLGRIEQLALLCVVALGWFYTRGHYERRVPFWTETQQILSTCLAMALVDGFLQFAAKVDASRLWLLSSWGIAAVLLAVVRRTVRVILDQAGLFALPTLVVGSGPAAEAAIQALRSERWLGYTLVATLDPDALDGEAWSHLMARVGARFVVVALDQAHGTTLDGLSASLSRDRVPFAVIPSLRGVPVLGMEPQFFFSHDVMLLVARDNLRRPMARLSKRAFDLLLSVLLVVFLSPTLLLAAIAVRLDGGPALYRQLRIGRGGRPFTCYKFRSMLVDGDAVLDRHLAAHPADAALWARFQKLPLDPRITRVGAVLRRTSFDEVPQLFNVLRGDMSLVGPRPCMPDQLDRYAEERGSYLDTRPGITGLWQVSGRNEVSFQQRVQLDAWYVRNWSLWHDIAILMKTVPVVLARRGAY